MGNCIIYKLKKAKIEATAKVRGKYFKEITRHQLRENFFFNRIANVLIRHLLLDEQ